MKLIWTAIVILLTGCGSPTYIVGPCPYVEPLERVKSETIVPNRDGSLGYYNTMKANRLVKKLRESEKYFIDNTTRIKEYRETQKIF